MNLKKAGKAILKSLSSGDVTQQTKVDEQPLPQSHIQAEEQYFTKVNDLKKEYIAEEQIISSSNLSLHQRPKWVVEEEYKGFMILTNDVDDVQDWKEMIDNGQTQAMCSVGYWHRMFNKKIVDTEDDMQLSHDDVDFEQQKMKEAGYFPKENEPDKNYVMPGKLPKEKL